MNTCNTVKCLWERVRACVHRGRGSHACFTARARNRNSAQDPPAIYSIAKWSTVVQDLGDRVYFVNTRYRNKVTGSMNLSKSRPLQDNYAYD